ncbi:MAG TPA: hypothetical protein VGG06_06525 [Thermoanaerobaculia bacterium]|jgi:hypothetical protein
MRKRDCFPALAAVLGAAVSAVAAGGELSVTGYLAARGLAVRGQPSWLAGGFGRLAAGAEAPDDEDAFALGLAHVALDLRPSELFGFYVHGAARAEPDVREGDEAGFVEAFVYGSARARRADVFRWRLGHFILPTSRENVEVAWSSPYTITFSALNSWIGEEVRLTGVLTEYSLGVGAVDELRLGAGAFGGNDAAGALLAWRGWSLGDRLTPFGELLALPPLDSLAGGGPFDRQLDRGTQPFGSDLDGRAGWAAYLRYARPQRTTLQWTHYDNRGDRGLHRGEYAWETELDLLGADLHLGDAFTLAGELLDGSTGMGFRADAMVQLDLRAAYLLASWRPGSFRVTLRHDRFETVDRDLTPRGEDNDEDGRAWTLAFFWEPDERWRLGLELLDLRAARPAAAQSGFDPDTDARSLILELRYYLDW